MVFKKSYKNFIACFIFYKLFMRNADLKPTQYYRWMAQC